MRMGVGLDGPLGPFQPWDSVKSHLYQDLFEPSGIEVIFGLTAQMMCPGWFVCLLV